MRSTILPILIVLFGFVASTLWADQTRIKTPKQIRGAVISKDGKQLLVLHDGGVLAIDPARKQTLYEVKFEGFGVYKGAIAIHSDGRVFAVGDNQGVIRFYSTKDGSQVLKDDSKSVGAMTTALAWVPGKKQLVTGHNGGTLSLVEAETGKVNRSQTSKNRVMWYDPSPVIVTSDGSHALTISVSYESKKVMAWAWNLNTLDLPRAIAPKRELKCTAIAESPDGKSIYLGCADGRIEIFDAQSFQSIKVLTEGDGKKVRYGLVNSFSWTKDNKTLLVGTSTGYDIYDQASGEKVKTVQTKLILRGHPVLFHAATNRVVFVENFAVSLESIE